MKLVRFLPIGLLLLVGAQPAPKPAPADPLAKLAFMSGVWAQDKLDGRTEEYWTPPRGGLMMGAGIEMKEGKAVFFEHLRIEMAEGKPVYIALPRGQKETRFTAVEWDETHVIFENPKHDFPTRIEYKEEDGGLYAAISGKKNGAEQKVEWSFKRN